MVQSKTGRASALARFSFCHQINVAVQLFPGVQGFVFVVCRHLNPDGQRNEKTAQLVVFHQQFMSSLPNDHSLLSEICYFVIIAILPAFAEEFAFRGVTLQLLRPYGEAFAVVGSAFAFGVMHGTVVQIPFAFVGGLFFGYLVVRTGSIWPSILLHFLNNSLSYFQELVQNHSQNFVYQETATVINYGLLFAATLGGLFCLAALLRKDKNFFRTNPDTTHKITDREKFKKYVGNPGMIIALIIITISMILQMTMPKLFS